MSIEISLENIQLASELNIIPNIHEKDFIFDFVKRAIWSGNHDPAVMNYYQLGDYSAKKVKDYIDDVERVVADMGLTKSYLNILDFASGYGGVARHLHKYFAGKAISTCDIHESAINFNKDVLGINSYLSSSIPEELDIPKQDLIFCLSFFTHMPEKTYSRWIFALLNRLNEGGILLFTSNGNLARSKLFKDWIVDDRGYGFVPDSEQFDLDTAEYGTTLAPFGFVFNILKNFPDVQLHRFHGAAWWNVQDTYVLLKNN